uniref:Claudin n=1 Tax=Denticeps clupeoides TaxID=299321 RepID=A0AAY4DGX4_9TELE
MKKRLMQIFGFLSSTVGWMFICFTLAMDYWRITPIGGHGGSWVIKAAWYWSNLWKDCFTDSTAVSNCKDFGVLWNVLPYIQGVRGLLMIGMSLGVVAAALSFLGLECTYIGGSDKTNDKLLVAGAVFHILGGLCVFSGYCFYTNRIIMSAYSFLQAQGNLRYSIGPPVFLGWVGSFLIISGAVLYIISTYSKNRLYSGYYRPSHYRSRGHAGSRLSKVSQVTAEKLPATDTVV